MASNNDWASLPQRKNGSNKKNKENQSKVLCQLKEMFGSTFESDIIASVAQSCNWKLESSIDALIVLTSEPPEKPNNPAISKTENVAYDPWRDEEVPGVPKDYMSNDNQNSAYDPWKDDQDTDRQNQNSSNTLSTTTQNISYDPWKDKKVPGTQIQSQTNSPFIEIKNSTYDPWTPDEVKSSQNKNFNSNSLIESQNSKYNPWSAKEIPNTRTETEISTANETGFFNIDDENESLQPKEEPSPQNTKESTQKIETASLCGLKVQYRPKGMENNSDDDVDVVIEEESSDTRIDVHELNSVNVCQFLSTSTQSPSKNTFPKAKCVSTASPARTPQRQPAVQNKVLTAQSRIEKDIEQGYKILILMRGVPGSGKSYLAKSIVSKMLDGNFNRHIFSTDDYFVMINRGVYAFDASRLQDAHSFNQNRVLNALRQEVSPIFVDNTNTQAWEMQAYAVMAVEHGYILETLEPDTPWFRNVHELDRRNKHRVPRAKIRQMLDRYEPDITGARLMRMFSLTYATRKYPPLLRKVPPVNEETLALKMKSIEMKDKTTTTSPQRRARKSKKSTNNDQPQRLIDNDALNTIAKEYANLEYAKPTNNESWTEGSSYKEESLLDLNLGAIGSERKAAGSKSTEENMETTMEDIAIEKSSTPTPDDVQGSEVAETKNSDLSQCWDFTLLLNGLKIHSRYERTPPEDEATKIQRLLNSRTIFVNNGEITYMRTIRKDDVDADRYFPSSSQKSQSDTIDIKSVNNEEKSGEILEEDTAVKIADKEPATANDKSSSTNSSLERVSDDDISMFEMCNSPEMGSEAKQSEIDDGRIEKQSSGGLGSIFKFIKNSFLGSEKENNTNSEKQENNDEPKSNSVDQLTEKLRNNFKLDESLTSKLSSSIVVTDDTSNDSLSSKFTKSNDTSGSNPNKIHDTSDEFLDARENPTHVEAELLEASSDFHLVDRHDIAETRPTPEIELDEKVSNVVAEKTFIEQMKNTISNSTSSISIDNVNMINWRESPFPLENVTIPSEESNEQVPIKCDRETYTDPYDFNVAYIGGTDDYKVLEAVSRSINEPNRRSPNELDNPSRKLMLHKGTMTNFTSVFYKETIFELETNTSDEDRGDELCERFPYLPRHFVLDVYNSLCCRDFYWAVDYLGNLQDDDANINAAIDHLETIAKDEVASGESNNRSESVLHRTGSSESSSTDSTEPSQSQLQQQQQQQPQIRSKRDRYRESSDTLSLKRQLEGKIVMSEESYPPHTLRVKRWKNRDFSETRSAESTELTAGNNAYDLAYLDNLSPEVTSDVTPPSTETKKPTRLDHPAAEEEAEQQGEDDDSLEDEIEEEKTMELKLGYEFIRVLESEFGNSNFQAPQGLFPVIQIRRSLAQELHALWIESMQRQLWAMQEQLDAMIAKDAEYARSLEVKEAAGISEPEVPNLKEIMDMEMALATYNNDNKQKLKKETYKDLSTRVAQKTLQEMFPEYDPVILYEIYEAHERDFEVTVKVIKENCMGKSTMTMADVLKKRKHLIDELQKESRYQTSRHNELETLENKASDEDYDEAEQPLTYQDAMGVAQESRAEARRQLGLRNENYQKASEACRQKNPEVAAYYSDMAKLHMRNMEMANSAAASAFLAAQAHTLEADDTLDLHFLHVSEAMQALDIFIEHQLEQMTIGSRKDIFIITGRGSRSTNGQSKIKPAVAKKLNSKNLRFIEVNPGQLKVLLRKK